MTAGATAVSSGHCDDLATIIADNDPAGRPKRVKDRDAGTGFQASVWLRNEAQRAACAGFRGSNSRFPADRGSGNLAAARSRYAMMALIAALITNPPKAGRPMWVFARKTMFFKGAATLGLNKVGGIMIKALIAVAAAGRQEVETLP